MKAFRLLTVGHSYVVSLNRRLAHELTLNAPAGWEVTVCAPQTLKGDLRPLELEFEPNEPCRTISVKTRLSSKIHLMSYDRKLKDILASNWDLVHAWEEPYIYCGSQIARWSRGRPLVYYTYQNISKVYPPPFDYFERNNIRRASGWIAGGETTLEALVSRPGYSERPHCIIPLGVDVTRFSPNRSAGEAIRRQLGWEVSGPPVIGYMGRFVREKGLETLMHALDDCHTPWRALFLGGGPLLSVLENWARSHPGQVAIVPSVRHDAVPAYLNAMDLLAAPSMTTPHWREQLGRMITESFACGIPVVASDSGEIPNVIASAGLSIEEANIPLWTKTLDRLLDDPAKRHEMSQAGRERAEHEFSWSVIARKHWDFFLRVLDESARSKGGGKLSAAMSTTPAVKRSSFVGSRPKRLLTIGHSYVLRVNRCLANEFQNQSGGKWEVTAVAPKYFHGRNDIRPLAFDDDPDESIRVEAIAARLSHRVHFFHYSNELRGLLNDGYDLVHAWEEPYIAVGFQIASLTPRDVPLVFRTAQSLDKNYVAPFNWIERYCVRRMNGWIYSGRLVEKNLLYRVGYANRPRCHAPLGFDPARMHVDRSAGAVVRRQYGWDDSVPVVGYLGRFVEDKGIGVVIEALSQLDEPWRAMFVGNGPMLPNLVKLSSEFPGRVALCTNVAHVDVIQYLNAMDMLLAPSLTMPNWREQFGRMIVEAFACGVPVIGSDSGEIPYVIGDSGVVVPERNSEALRQAIATMMNDSSARQRYAASGLERAHQEYTWAKIAAKTLSFFDELIEQHK